MNIDDIYTPLEEAKEEIWKRWEDKDLEKKVNEYLVGNIPEPFLKEPRGICTSHVATPNWFFFSFFDKTKEIGLKPIVFEYLDDLFVTTNFDKASLAKMVFYHGKDDHGDMLTSSRHVIDLGGKNEKKKIKELCTLWGENFVDFHHRATNEFCEDVEIYDGSEWYHKMGKRPSDYYKYVLAFYLRNGILFENYLLNEKEEKFIKNVLIPAFEFVKNEFGIKPLIVPLAPRNEEDSRYWWSYPEFIKILINRKQNGNK